MSENETNATQDVVAAPEAASPATPSSGLVVHHLNNSRSQRVLWLLEELQVPYEIKLYHRTPEMLAPKELLEVHPLGKSPVITDGPLTLAESGAIVEYVISKYGNGKGKPISAGEVDNLYFTHYAEGSLMPLAVMKYIFQLIPGRLPLLLRPLMRPVFSSISSRLVDPQLKKHSELIETHLEKTQGDFWVGGPEPTSADYMMLFPLEGFTSRAPEILGPKTKAYVERIHARDAYKRALEKGGPYDYA